MAEIVTTPEVLGGTPRIGGRRIGVHHVVTDALDGGLSPERIAAEYDLDAADVHWALAHYCDHPEEIRAVRRRARKRMAESDRTIRPEDVGPARGEPAEPDA
jgi:uncharacterized protein (DUF433 family)